MGGRKGRRGCEEELEILYSLNAQSSWTLTLIYTLVFLGGSLLQQPVLGGPLMSPGHCQGVIGGNTVLYYRWLVWDLWRGCEIFSIEVQWLYSGILFQLDLLPSPSFPVFLAGTAKTPQRIKTINLPVRCNDCSVRLWLISWPELCIQALDAQLLILDSGL